MRSLFRKEALESFSSNSTINKGVRAISIKAAVFTLLLAVCAAAFAVWLVLGTVYETVSVNGIIWPAENNGGVYAKSGGVITKTVVSSGDAVKAGDILAVIPQEDILIKIKKGKESGISPEALNALYDEYDRLSVVRSSIDGIVTSIADENVFISKGDKIAAVVPYSESGNNKTLTAFIPSDKGGLVALGMEAQVMPDCAPREKYGYIQAYISGVSSYPVTGQSIKDANGELFLSTLDERESYLQLEITLMPDADAQSRVKWSNPNSGDMDVAMGTVCGADIVIEKCRPYEWLF
ncbi:MAG: hypothetical protein PUD92_02935 [Clostridiales bacterium]|nr:hypothetical protein [Clostridiales bacterium]